MIRFRAFHNGDSPALAEIWSHQPPLRGRVRNVSALMLEDRVLSKPYFDRQGLIVAEEEGKPVGFVHAGFGPTEDMTDLSTEAGVTCMLMVAPQASGDAIADQLLVRAEQYLTQRGARVVYGGGIFPLNPFYLGWYGGSELPGVLASDHAFTSVFLRSGYREADRVVVLHAELDAFRPPVDRRQIQVRRAYRLETSIDPPAENWWQACSTSPAEYTQFELVPACGGRACASAALWNMEPLSDSCGGRAGGLVRVTIQQPHRRQGLGTYLLGGILRQLKMEGVAHVEVQAMRRNTAALGLYGKLGFQEIDQGVVFRKDASG